MTLNEDIAKIKNDPSLDYGKKAELLGRLVAGHEITAILGKPPVQVARLKEKLYPKKEKMRILRLSVHGVHFDGILNGEQKEESRAASDYYLRRCTYVEGGTRYIIPFDAITFYQGKRNVTVALTDITCDGDFFVFCLGEILSRS
mgnify:CR=1 FL=1